MSFGRSDATRPGQLSFISGLGVGGTCVRADSDQQQMPASVAAAKGRAAVRRAMFGSEAESRPAAPIITQAVGKNMSPRQNGRAAGKNPSPAAKPQAGGDLPASAGDDQSLARHH